MYSIQYGRETTTPRCHTALVLLYPPGHQATASRTQLDNKKMRGLMALGGGVLQVKGGHFEPIGRGMADTLNNVVSKSGL